MERDFSNCQGCQIRSSTVECPIYGSTVTECPMGDEPDWNEWDEDNYVTVHEDEGMGRIEAQVQRAR